MYILRDLHTSHNSTHLQVDRDMQTHASRRGNIVDVGILLPINGTPYLSITFHLSIEQIIDSQSIILERNNKNVSII